MAQVKRTTPKVTVRSLPDYIAPSSEEIEAQGGTVGHSLKLREWWQRRLEGETHIRVPDLAREALAYFSDNARFRETFWDYYAYDVIYNAGIDLLSERRLFHDGEGGMIEGLEAWFERSDDGHVSLASASDAEWDHALFVRQEEVHMAQVRLDALRALRDGQPVAGVRGVVWNIREETVPPPLAVMLENPSIREFSALAVSITHPPSGNPASETAISANGSSPDPLADTLAALATGAPNGFAIPTEAGVSLANPDCEHCTSDHLVGTPREDCACCVGRYGEHLVKSCGDYFDYAMRLTSGDLIYYKDARIVGSWVYLNIEHWEDMIPTDAGPQPTYNPPFARGLQVKLSEIAWVADAPFGS